MIEEPEVGVEFKKEYDLEELTNKILHGNVNIQAREKIYEQEIDELYQVTLYDHLALKTKELTDEYTTGIQKRTIQHILGDEDHMRYMIGEATITLSYAKNATGETRDYNLARTQIIIELIEKAIQIMTHTPEERIKEYMSTTTLDEQANKDTEHQRIKFDKE